MNAESAYLFVAQDRDGRSVLLSIAEQDERCADYFRLVWERLCTALKNYHDQAAVQRREASQAPPWVHWKPESWCRDRKIPDRQRFAAWAGSSLVGFVNLRPGYPSQHEEGQRLLYVEHLATAPGNLSTDLWTRRLQGVGTALMAYIILQAQQQGFGGRIGLHAASPDAASYYESLRLRFSFFHPPRQGVAGTPEDKKAQEKPYFESIPARALAFLEDYRHG